MQKSGVVSIGTIVAFFLVFFLFYGTPSPCGALKSKMHLSLTQSMMDNPIGLALMGSLTPAIDAQIDELNIFQCVKGIYNLSQNEDEPANAISDKPEAGMAISAEEFLEEKKAIEKIKTGWEVDETISPIDDSKQVTLYKESEGEVGSGWSTYRPKLIFRCKENNTSLYVSTSEMVKDSGSIYNQYVPVITRYDSDPAEERKMGKSSSSDAFFFSTPIKEIKTMNEKNKLTVRYHTYGGSERTVIFNLKKLDDHLPELREACGW